MLKLSLGPVISSLQNINLGKKKTYTEGIKIILKVASISFISRTTNGPLSAVKSNL